MQHKLREEARGRWYSILSHYIESDYLKPKHGKCPLCGGKDRFRWDDKDGDGTYICNSCGAGSGLHLLAQHQGLDHREAAKLVWNLLPNSEVKKPVEKKKSDVPGMWKSSTPIEHGDDVERYLQSRGINKIPSGLRKTFHMGYVCMIGKIEKNGKGVGVHLTYLQDGKKAPIEITKRIFSIRQGEIVGGCIQLEAATDRVLIAEGIETALSAGMRFGYPSWSAMNANCLEQIQLPESVREVLIASDNDASFTGQAAAYSLAKRLRLDKREVIVEIPSYVDTDWNDWSNHLITE